jgi:FHS family L-fucose permease-like MFS transporter
MNTQPAPPAPPATRHPYRFAFAMITTLFFLWGFAHNLDPILIPHLKRAFSLSVLQSSLVDSAVFIAYFLMALPAGLLIRKLGYQHTIVIGLLLFATGAFLFIPAAYTQQYSFFLAALFVIACGLTTLETAANPYVNCMGTPARAAWRLNLAQSFNGLAATLAPVIGARLILVQGTSDVELAAASATVRADLLAAEAASVTGPYLVLGLAILVVAAIFSRLKLPVIGHATHATHAAKADQPAGGVAGIGAAWRRRPIRHAVIAQFFYVGAQVCVFSFFILYAAHSAGLSQHEAADYLGWGCGAAFMLGRFAGTWCMRFVEPARLLLGYSLASAVLAGVAVAGAGMLTVYAIIGIAFFMSIMFPTIFSLGIRDAGAHTEMGSSLIIMSIVGGALLPLLFGWLSDATGDIRYGYLVPLVCFLVTGWFARNTLKHNRATTVSPQPSSRSNPQHV